MTIEELFGTLQQSVVASWRKHLKTDKYSKHMALDEFYKEMPDLVDDLIEDWQGINGKVQEYVNLLDDESEMDTITYLERLKEIASEGRELLGEPELESDMDAICSQIDSTLYKVRELTESHVSGTKSLKDYLFENMRRSSVDESIPGGAVLWQAYSDIAMFEESIVVVTGAPAEMKKIYNHCDEVGISYIPLDPSHDLIQIRWQDDLSEDPMIDYFDPSIKNLAQVKKTEEYTDLTVSNSYAVIDLKKGDVLESEGDLEVQCLSADELLEAIAEYEEYMQ